MATFGFMSSFPPTKCGLATFADALAGAMLKPGDTAIGVRVVHEPTLDVASADNVRIIATLVANDPWSVSGAIAALNSSDVAVIQHEYGIYGGPDGNEVLAVMGGLTVPCIAVLHTVLDAPTPGQRHVLNEVMHLASSVVVMSEAARALLATHYDAGTTPVHVIPHGVAPLGSRAVATALANASRTRNAPRPVVLTWGLIGPGKGIEWGIRAMAQLTDMVERPLYLVVGETHPKVLEREGEDYRTSLQRIARSLGVEDDVRFDSTYHDRDTLWGLVASASLVLLPYDNSTQITSGVLAEAVTAGKPVVATAFPHAIELLATGAGVIVAHRDPAAIAAAIRTILTHPEAARRMSHVGEALAADASWPAVGRRYRALALGLATMVAA